jgi:hypothetical protein
VTRPLGLLEKYKVMVAAIVVSSQPLRFYLEILFNNINFYTTFSKKPRAS